MYKYLEAQKQHAHDLIKLQETLDTESEFFLFMAGERKMPLPRQEKLISASNTIYILAFDEYTLVGYIAGIRDTTMKSFHNMELVMGVLKSHQGKGIGRELLETLTRRAKEEKVHWLRLKVLETNEKAIDLYKRAGFVEMGKQTDYVSTLAGFKALLIMEKKL